MRTKIKALSMFTSIQGEGITIGEPSLFIRLPNCNLSCSFCDTASELKSSPKEFDLSKIQKFPSNLIITGGEPLLPSNERTISTITTYLYHIKNFKYLTIETNGTLIPLKNVFFSSFPETSTLYSVSPKFNHINSKVLSFFNSSKINSQFKFVVNESYLMPQLSIIQNLISSLSLKKPIIIQPQTSPTDTLPDYYQKCTLISKQILSQKINARLIPQLHYILNLK